MSNKISYELPAWYKKLHGLTSNMTYEEAKETLLWYIQNEMGGQEEQICLEALDIICSHVNE